MERYRFILPVAANTLLLLAVSGCQSGAHDPGKHPPVAAATTLTLVPPASIPPLAVVTQPAQAKSTAATIRINAGGAAVKDSTVAS